MVSGYFAWFANTCKCNTTEHVLIQALVDGAWTDVGTFGTNVNNAQFGTPGQLYYNGSETSFGKTVTATSWRYVPKSFNSGQGTQVLGSLIFTYGGVPNWNYQP